MEQKDRAKKILSILKKTYKERGPFVAWSNPLELVIGTVLSAQCTDKRVNETTKTLFKKYKTARDYADADIRTLEKEIYSIGFYRSKAKYLKGIGKILSEKYGGGVPDTLEALLELPGVSSKTAHLIMAKAFGKLTGIAVDTHVKRVAPRLGFTKEKTPEKIGRDLEKIFPSKHWLEVNEYFILHGRAICKGKPRCPECPVKELCPSAGGFIKKYWKRK